MYNKITDSSTFHYIDLPTYNDNGIVKNKKPFVEQVEYTLRNDLQEYDTFGCRIQNCHTHAGSKLHFHNFIEAELLFHNSYYNQAFARLTMEWIWNEYMEIDAEYENILLIGYEMFSELYLQELRKKLKEKGGNVLKNCEYCVYETISKSMPDGSRKKESHIRNLEKIENNFIKLIYGDLVIDFISSKTLCVFIVPINTSLSTMDKMVAKFLDKVTGAEQFINRTHICLITLGNGGDGVFFEAENDMLKPAKSKFENLDEYSIKNLVYLEIESNTLARQCPDCFPDINSGKSLTDENPMFGVNRDSVVPMLKIDQKKYVEPIDENVSKLNLENLSKVYKLSEFLRYHHIVRGENHYQYYFDTEKFLQKNFSDIESFLINSDKKINTLSKIHVFDYLVAPRHQSNSGWVHLVNKTIFKNSARIIYFDVEKEFRSNIKAKYSDIIAAFKNIQNSKQKYILRFHFVDDVIQTGSTFMRAKNLLNSLTDSISDKSTISLFDSIILLVNRLSVDSKRFYLDKPEINKFLSYVDVNISSMRNYEDACTLCKLISDYHNIKNECATNKLTDICINVIKQHEVCSSYDISKLVTDTEFDRLEKRYVFYLSHLLNECISNKISFENNLFSKEEPEKNVDEIKDFLSRCYSSKKIQKLLNIKEFRNEQLLKTAFIKAVSRPFFIYHIRLRQAAFSFCLKEIDELLFAENHYYTETELINRINNISSSITDMQPPNNHFADIANKIKLDISELTKNLQRFYEACFPSIILRTLIKALSDMNANYIIREKIINQLFIFSNVGEQLAKSIFKMIETINAASQLDGTNPFKSSLFNEEELLFLAKSLLTNDALLHYLKKDIVLSRDETKALLLEYILLTGKEQHYFDNEQYNLCKQATSGFLDENNDFTIKGKLYLENNSILKNILGNDSNLNKLIKELEHNGNNYKADELYFFENFKTFWNINTIEDENTFPFEGTNHKKVLINFKDFFHKYRELKKSINDFARNDKIARRNFIKAMNEMLCSITNDYELKAIPFVHDSNEDNPLFQFYTISDVSPEKDIELLDCKYNNLMISQAFFHDANIREIKDRLNGKKIEDLFFIDDKLSNTANKKTLIVRFCKNQTTIVNGSKSEKTVPDESIYIQFFGFDIYKTSHWFTLKLLLSLRENFAELIQDVNLQELIEERKVEMKQKALSINKATTHSKAEKYFMTRPITENIGKYTEISDIILKDWMNDDSVSEDYVASHKNDLLVLNSIDRIERKAYSTIMKLPSDNLRHRWTLYDKYYQLLSDELLSSFYRKIITKNISIDKDKLSFKKMIETVFNPNEIELTGDLSYKSETYITMHSENGQLVKCKIIFGIDESNLDGHILYTYEHACNMSIYVFIIILMAMNAVQHGNINNNDEDDVQSLEVTLSSNKLTFVNNISNEQISKIEQDIRYWYIPPWVFDKGNQHITIWTLLHMSDLTNGEIEFNSMLNKEGKKFITEFMFKEDKNESNKNL